MQAASFVDGAPGATWTFPAVAGSLSDIRRALDGFCERRRVPSGVVSDLQLAVSEAATNAVVHAFVGLEAGVITVATAIKDGKIVVEVRDDGRGMRPNLDSPGLGFGLPLMGNLSHRLDIGGGPGEKGTRVTMQFALDDGGPGR